MSISQSGNKIKGFLAKAEIPAYIKTKTKGAIWWEFWLYFLTILGLFCSAFFIISVVSARLLDRIVVLPSSTVKEPIKGDEATILIGGQKIEAFLEDVIYLDDNLTRSFVFRALR